VPRQRPFLNRSPHLGVTVQAIRHLLARLVLIGPGTRQFIFQWIDWRIRHNEQARKAHY
jgi:hypothetical protein